MARLVRVDDAADPKLADYMSLRDVNLRRSLEAEHGLFLAEGEKVVRRAVEAGFPVRSFLMSPRWLPNLADVLDAAADAPCYLVSDQVAESVTGFHVHRGALASMARVPLPGVAEVLVGSRRVLMLEDIVDHTNVGAIFRTAAALGIDGILLSPRCADPLYRRSVKVSMGAVLRLPYARFDDWYDAVDLVRRHGFRTVALTPRPDVPALDDLRMNERPVALLLGSEGHGLSHRWLEGADVRARIAMREWVDSLNVAATAAIACYVMSGRALGEPSERAVR